MPPPLECPQLKRGPLAATLFRSVEVLMETPSRVNISALSALVPMAHVASVARSIGFYEKLGFELRNAFTPLEQDKPTWAWLQSGGPAP